MIKYAELNNVSFIYELSKRNLRTSFKKETLKQYIKEKLTYHVFICEDKEPVGFIIVWESDTFGQIIDLVVKENKRSLGYGEKLMLKAIRFLTEKGVKTLSLEVSIENHNAIKLYEKLGFKKEKIIKNYYNNVDGLLYVRSL